MDELAICAIFKNEQPYIEEWLSYHYALGVRRFVLYDNASTDGTRAAIEGWPRRDVVTVVDWPQQGAQVQAYVDMVVRFRGVAEWCAFIDCDEFLCPQSSLSLPDVVRRVGASANGLYVHWWMFGSSGHATRQPGLVTETFRHRAPDEFGSHYFGKSIMRLSQVTHAGLHQFRCNGPMVNDSGWQVDPESVGMQAQKSHRLLALNHYFTKSRQEWFARRALGKADKPEGDPEFRRADGEFAQHDLNAVRDDRAALFMQAARALFYLPPPAEPLSAMPSPAHLLTAHGSILCWDSATARAVHCPLEQISEMRLPLQCELQGAPVAQCRLLHQDAGGGPAPIDGAAEFSLVRAGPGATLQLRADGVFLCAEGGSEDVHANRTEAREWETFLAVAPQDVTHLRTLSADAARLLPGFQLLLDDDRYDLQWAIPQARLAAMATATPRSRTARSLRLYDLSAEEAPAPRPRTTGAAPAIGPTLAALRDECRIEAIQIVSEPEARVRIAPFLARPAGNPVAPYAGLFTDPAYRDYMAAGIACYGLPDGCILGGDGLVWFEDRLVRDSVQSLEPWRAEMLAAETAGAGAASLALKRSLTIPASRPEALFCGFVGAWRNYAHWLTECLPRLFLYRSLLARLPSVRLVLPRLDPDSAQARSVRLLGIHDAQIVTIADDEPLAGHIIAVTGIDPWALPSICAQAAVALADAVEAEADEPPDPEPASRIYVRRGTDTRRLLNLDGLRDVLDRYGVRTVTMQDMTLSQQVRTMRAARIVVGENGAALANIMFCRPGARVLELFNEAWANPAHWTLASLCGLEYGFVEGRHVPSALAPAPSHNADYVITPDQLETGLRAMTGAS